MMRKTILVIGMVDSIHLARWLSLFVDHEVDFSIFPSKKFRHIHPILLGLLKNNHSSAHFRLLESNGLRVLAGYLDFLKYEIFKHGKKFEKRVQRIEHALHVEKFEYLHAIELQGAGYLLTDVNEKLLNRSNVIVTNWGSDIVFFHQNDDHLRRIKKILNIADYYSAECVRDYQLARLYGFRGVNLPRSPNSGGFSKEQILTNSQPPSQRLQIMVKGYGGMFGRADVVIDTLETISSSYPEYTFLFYSTTSDSKNLIKKLPLKLQSKIRIYGINQSLSWHQILQEFRKSRIYIGCSESDGLSTSFLEALICGTYPIQSNTSCANELLELGARGTLVGLDRHEVLESVLNALGDDELVDRAAVLNRNFALQNLSVDSIKKTIGKFYR